jgi:hypothetical protein
MVEDHGKTVDAGLPAQSLTEALREFRRPFTPEAVRFKVQTVFKDAKGCIVVGYIDARLVIERLNAVVAHNWEASYRPVEGQKSMLWCDLTLRDDDSGFGGAVTRSDVGEGQGVTEGMRYKAAVSDSLKRAAVHFGIGVSVYALPQITLFPRDGDKRLEHAQTAQGKPTLRLTETGHVRLREGYAKWLEASGVELFGEPLNHGDVEGQTVDEDEMAADEFVPEPPIVPTDDRTTDLIDKARGFYEREVDHGKLPPARFNAMLRGASHSHSELERFITYLEGVATSA